MMKGWILYKRPKSELSVIDHGVNRLVDAAVTFGIQLEVYCPEQIDIRISSPPLIYLNGELADRPDFIIPRLGADTPYAALMIIRQLELTGVISINSSSSVEMVRDKLWVGQLMQHHNLPVPPTMLVKPSLSVEMINRQIGFPLVLKTLSGARGLGVCLCESTTAFVDLIGLLGLYSADNRQVLIQKFIANSYGRDLRVFVLGDKVIGCMQRTAKESFKANYSLGGSVESYPITQEIEDLSLSCTRVLGLEIAGIDLLFGEEGLLICEANSSPGFKGMELATGTDIASLILSYVVEKVNSKDRATVHCH